MQIQDSRQSSGLVRNLQKVSDTFCKFFCFAFGVLHLVSDTFYNLLPLVSDTKYKFCV